MVELGVDVCGDAMSPNPNLTMIGCSGALTLTLYPLTLTLTLTLTQSYSHPNPTLTLPTEQWKTQLKLSDQVGVKGRGRRRVGGLGFSLHSALRK